MSATVFPREIEVISRHRETDDTTLEQGSSNGKAEAAAAAAGAVVVVEDEVFVAVGKNFKENKSVVVWALQNSGGRRIRILHVHQPAQTIPVLGGRFPISQVGKLELAAFREQEKSEMLKALDKYDHLCAQAGVKAQRLYVEADCIEDEIVSLISQKKIGRLVMGAAADDRYSRKMVEPKSKKALHVSLHAPDFCHIWFVCKSRLINTRKSIKQQIPDRESRHSNSSRSSSTSVVHKNQPDVDQGKFLKSPSAPPHLGHEDVLDAFSTQRVSSDLNGGADGTDRRSRSMSELAGPSSSSLSMIGRENELQLVPFFGIVGNHPGSSSPLSVLQGSSLKDELFDRLERIRAEAETLRLEVFAESSKRTKAEKDTIEAIRKARAAESLYFEEHRKRIEIEEQLTRRKEELDSLTKRQDEVLEELQVAIRQKSSLESKIENASFIMKELEDKIVSAVSLLQKFKKEREEAQIERDNALGEVEKLRKQLSESNSMTTNDRKFYAEFSYSEIASATDNFSPSKKIGEGGYGSIYRAHLRYTEVAIKVLNPHGKQGREEFQREVDVLSTLRHANIVTLIGICKEASALIYEYLPNGSLEDRLNCKDNSPPLSWQIRIQIAIELCSVLIFLHSNKPQIIIHGDLKPSNVLLDGQLSSKLSDFGICRGISNREMSEEDRTDNPKGTFGYMDPEFVLTGEFTVKSDVYSYGIILLQLLTGKVALRIQMEVEDALNNDKLDAVLDPTAGDWPFVMAKQLAHLALRCCDMRRENRPDLVGDIWRVIESMRPFQIDGGIGDKFSHAPAYFKCPIFQEIMQDPHIAADGFTYEAEAVKGWIDGGHETSPMTNLKLPNHSLIPNRALRSAIQEWLQQQRRKA